MPISPGRIVECILVPLSAWLSALCRSPRLSNVSKGVTLIRFKVCERGIVPRNKGTHCAVLDGEFNYSHSEPRRSRLNLGIRRRRWAQSCKRAVHCSPAVLIRGWLFGPATAATISPHLQRLLQGRRTVTMSPTDDLQAGVTSLRRRLRRRVAFERGGKRVRQRGSRWEVACWPR